VLVALFCRLNGLRECSIGGRHQLGQLRRPAGYAAFAGDPSRRSCARVDSETLGTSRSRRPQSQYVLGEVGFSYGEPVLDRFLKSSGSSMKLSDGAVCGLAAIGPLIEQAYAATVLG
jgi:hypothetical protein